IYIFEIDDGCVTIYYNRKTRKAKEAAVKVLDLEKREALQEMRATAQLMEDDLLNAGMREYERTGTLSSPDLCKKSTEYENYLLSVRRFEDMPEEHGGNG
ncbi:MAG TPA: hypothetical protein VN512_12550, partial [Clostridia bacterium]|nr:hypothetical protein [Clostridia bacterium]